MPAQRALLDGQRWHFQHGPIDIVIGADGDREAIEAAHEAAWQRFQTVLAELVQELPLLRAPVQQNCPLRGPVARRMWAACAAFWPEFITPMAAVAGSVAQELIAAYQRPGVSRAWVNNGGDIALHLAPGASLNIGLVADLSDVKLCTGSERLRTDAAFCVHAGLPVRGVATSGWRGRSFSFGIADSVTVLAHTAAQADAAATIIANAVNVEHPAITRQAANTLRDDTDLGSLAVTVDVPRLPEALVKQALQTGRQRAQMLQDQGLIWAAMLVCQGRFELLNARVEAAELVQ